MNILIAIHHFLPNFKEGAELSAHRAACVLKEKGHDVHVLCIESINYGDGKRFIQKEENYFGISITRLYFNLNLSPEPFLWSFNNPIIVDVLKSLSEQFKPDLFHLFSGYLITGSSIETMKSLRIPVFLTLTDFWFLCPRITLIRSDGTLCTTPAEPVACALCLRKERRRYRWVDQLTRGLAGRVLTVFWKNNRDKFIALLQQRKAYLKSVFSSVDVAISPSHFLKDFYQNNSFCPQKFSYFRQGLDFENWQAKSKTRNKACLRIGYIGQIAKHKGLDVLIEAYLNLRIPRGRAKLTLYGNTNKFPEYFKKLKRKTTHRKDIGFAGEFENIEIFKIHTNIDILVVPSLWYENSPSVILEAFAAGTPVVTSNLGGMAELVKNNVHGFLFERGNVKSLERVLQKFIDQRDLAALLGKSTPEVKSITQETDELIHLYASYFNTD